METKPLVGRIRRSPLLLHPDPSHNSAMQCVAAVALEHNYKKTEQHKHGCKQKHQIRKLPNPSHRTMQCSVAAVALEHKYKNTQQHKHGRKP